MPRFEPEAIAVVVGVYLTFVICALLSGRRQRREVDATWGRLIRNALVLPWITTLPLLVAILMGGKVDMDWTDPEGFMILESAEEVELRKRQGIIADPVFDPATKTWSARVIQQRQEPFVMHLLAGPWPGTPPVNLLVVLTLWLLSVAIVSGTFQPVWRLLQQRAECAAVTDPVMLERVAELAGRMGMAPPKLLRIAASEVSSVMNAAALDVQRPTIVATDSILDRMDAEENRAILAHEMGHLARRHLRYTLLRFAIVVTGFSVVSAFLFPTVTLALLLWVLIVVRRISGRREEEQCDLLAARAVGFASTAQALDRICGQTVLDSGPTLTRITEALDEHPAHDLRLQLLHDAAPAAERDRISFDAGEASAQRRADRLVVGVMLAVVVFGVFAGLSPALQYWGLGVLGGAILLRAALPWLSVLPRLYYAWQLRERRDQWSFAVKAIAVLGLLVLGTQGFEFDYAWPTFVAIALAFGWVFAQRRKRRRLAPIYAAVGDGDLELALQRCDELPARWQRGRVHRYYRAHLYAAMDRVEESLALLDALAQENERAYLPQLLRAVVIGWSDPDRAREVSQFVVRCLPRNPHALASLAVGLSWSGELDAAERAIRQAIRTLPAEGSFYGVHSAVLRRQGELERSAEALAELESRDPGSISIPIYRGYLCLARGELEAAREAAAQARALAEKDRMSLRLPDVRRLEAELTAS